MISMILAAGIFVAWTFGMIYLGWRTSVLAALLLLALPSNADACNRCGLFGLRCRYAKPVYYAPKYVAPVVYPPNVQNFVFNNSFPIPQLGNTAYGYSLQASAYTQDNAMFLNRAGMLAELSQQNAQRGYDGFVSAGALSLQLADAADRRQKNTLLALTAMEANGQAQQPQAMSFRATVVNGRLSIERIDPGQTGPQQQTGNHRGSIAACAKCHDGREGPGKAPAASVIDGTVALSFERYTKAARRVLIGEMPPNSDWTIEEKTACVAELATLLQPAQAQPPPNPQPPANGGELK